MIEKDNSPFGPADQVGYFFGDMAGNCSQFEPSLP